MALQGVGISCSRQGRKDAASVNKEWESICCLLTLLQDRNDPICHGKFNPLRILGADIFVLQFFLYYLGATEHSCSVEGFYYWPVTQGKNETRDLGKEYEMPKVLFFI